MASSACSLRSFSTGTWWKGTPAATASGSRSRWLEITATISASSSPRRQRQSRSSRQWSWRETRIAMRWRSPHQRISQSISKRPATCCVESSCSKARPSSGSVPGPRGRTRCAGRTCRRWDPRSTGGRRRCSLPARTGSRTPRPRSPGGRRSRSAGARCSAGHPPRAHGPAARARTIAGSPQS